MTPSKLHINLWPLGLCRLAPLQQCCDLGGKGRYRKSAVPGPDGFPGGRAIPPQRRWHIRSQAKAQRS